MLLGLIGVWLKWRDMDAMNFINSTQNGDRSTGCNCLPCNAASIVSGIRDTWATKEQGFLWWSSCPNGTKYTFLALYSIPRFLKFIPILSLLEMEMTSGFSLRRCAFAAISTGVSVIPFTNFAIVLPVHGAMTSASKGAFGPIGSASWIVYIPVFPVMRSTFYKRFQLQ